MDMDTIQLLLLVYALVACAESVLLGRRGYDRAIVLALGLLWPIWVLLYVACKVGEWLIDPWL